LIIGNVIKDGLFVFISICMFTEKSAEIKMKLTLK
jgi:hypothetical protein